MSNIKDGVFARISNGFKPLTIFEKRSILCLTGIWIHELDACDNKPCIIIASEVASVLEWVISEKYRVILSFSGCLAWNKDVNQSKDQ